MNQVYLVPPSLQEWLPSDHLARFVADVVATLDLSEILQACAVKDRRARGRPSYHPQMLTTLLVYAYCVGMPSSRKIERSTWDVVAFRFLAGDEHPDHDTIASFRKKHLKALAGLFVQVLRLCQEAGLVKLGHVSLDGTKVKANASKHKAMSYERMLKNEAELAAEVKRLLEEADQTDRDEDDRFGKGRHGDELPRELARSETRLAKLREARAALEAEAAAAHARDRTEKADEAEKQAQNALPAAREKAEQRATQKRAEAEAAAVQAAEKARAAGRPTPDVDPRDPDTLPAHQVRFTRDGAPHPKAQRNFTDPDSRIMKRNGAFEQDYNCQAVVDETCQVIVAEAVTNQAPDAEHLRPMLEQVEENCGALPTKLSGDAGYLSEANLEACEERGVDAYLATGRKKHGEVVPPAVRGRTPKHLTARERMERKLRTKAGREIYARRKVIVEPVFGQIKEAQGIRAFSLRGQENVQGEWSLITLSHNLLKLYRHSWKPALTG